MWGRCEVAPNQDILELLRSVFRSSSSDLFLILGSVRQVFNLHVPRSCASSIFTPSPSVDGPAVAQAEVFVQSASTS